MMSDTRRQPGDVGHVESIASTPPASAAPDYEALAAAIGGLQAQDVRPLGSVAAEGGEDGRRVEQMRRAISWACGAEPEGFEPPPGVRSQFWWRSELCARAGLDWNGTEFTFDAARSAEQGGV